MDLSLYQGKNIHIVGVAGAEGSAIATFLANNVANVQLTGHDLASNDEDFAQQFFKTHLSLKAEERQQALADLKALPMYLCLGVRYLSDIQEADIIFVSQVWFKYPQNLPILEDLRNSGVVFKTITNLYFELSSCKIVSVTGTNGKTTTSNFLNQILKIWCQKQQLNFYFAGNDRQNIQVLDELSNMQVNDIFLLETSSTQLLLNSGISPHVGVITNITPNHLDDHGTFDNYISAKENLLRYQYTTDWAVLNYDNVHTREMGGRCHQVVYFSTKEILSVGGFLQADRVVMRYQSREVELFDLGDLQVLGVHNVQNALAAACAAFCLGVEESVIREGIRAYRGIKHRLQLLYKIHNVQYIDDTQATTPEATMAGVGAFSEKIILVLGGDNKGMNYKNLGQCINQQVSAVILFPGSAYEDIKQNIDTEQVSLYCVQSFTEMATILPRLVSTYLIDGGVVLISPAAAHFYSNFVETTGQDLRYWIKKIALR